MSFEADTIVPLYQRHAQAYDRLRGRSLFEKPWLDAFAALLPQGGTALDIGCGMGEPIARDLIARGLAVTGIDSSPDLIAMAQARSRSSAGSLRICACCRLAAGSMVCSPGTVFFT